MPIWHEDDDFWAGIEPQLFDEARVKAAVADVDNVVNLLGLGPGARVLDLGCGPGRHSLELARRGYAVTGVDRTGAYLKHARERAGTEDLQIEFIQEDMRRFCRGEAYDGAINLFTSFGYFDDPEEDLQVLRNLNASIKPGRRLVMQAAGKEILARIFTTKDWLEYPDGSFFLAEREVEPGWGAIRNKWIVLRDGEKKVFEFSLRVYSATELGAIIREAGFSSVELYGDLAGHPYDREAKFLVAVAEK